jgi:hypothetical protein
MHVGFFDAMIRAALSCWSTAFDLDQPVLLHRARQILDVVLKKF